MGSEAHCHLNGRHGPENIDLVFGFKALVGGVSHIAVEIELVVVAMGAAVVNQAEQEHPLALVQIVISFHGLQAVDQISVGIGLRLQVVEVLVVLDNDGGGLLADGLVQMQNRV